MNLFLTLLHHIGIEQPSILAWATGLDGITMAEAWQACPQGDWLIHIAYKLQLEARDLALAAVAAARCALPIGAGHVRLQYLLGQIEGLLDGDPRDYTEEDADAALRDLAYVEVASLVTPLERAVYGAGEAWASIPDPRQTRAFAADAAWEAARHIAVTSGASVDEDGEVLGGSREAAEAHVAVADAVRSALSWQCVVGSRGLMLRWFEERTEKNMRRAA
jgi:hypothetical protein